MAENPVISNTTPLIALSGINQLSLFRDLYTEVWIPREVKNEFLAIDESIHREVLYNSPWIKTVELTKPENAPVYTELDPGEAGVFALASECTMFNLLFLMIRRRDAKPRIWGSL